MSFHNLDDQDDKTINYAGMSAAIDAIDKLFEALTREERVRVIAVVSMFTHDTHEIANRIGLHVWVETPEARQMIESAKAHRKQFPNEEWPTKETTERDRAARLARIEASGAR